MEEIVDPHQYDAWNSMAKNIAFAAWAIAILIALYHVVRLATMNDAKTKYDYINRSEIKTLWIASVILVIGCCFYANANIVELNALWIFVRVFTTFAMGLIVANHMGLPCCAISVLTDDCDPDNLKPVNIADIIAVAGRSEPALTNLYKELIARI